MNRLITASAPLALATLAATAGAQVPPGESPVLGPNRITQADITGGGLSLDEIRQAGMQIFAGQFNKFDGYGDGPVNPLDTVSPGNRPTLQNNGTFLRVNGLDAQTCQECHSVSSNAQTPFRFDIGAAGGSNNNAIFQPKTIDVDDNAANGFAFFDGRYINPPFLTGSGGIELLAKEMTADLQALKIQAMAQPGTAISLDTKGVNFGSLTFNIGSGFDNSNVEGIDDDLVVRPFGRKGDVSTVRAFDIGAMEFHLGMQPSESVGVGVDGDGDGVADEILIGELSALHIFNTNLRRQFQEKTDDPTVRQGRRVFHQIGCAECHIPSLQTNSNTLTYSFPEVETAPFDNVFFTADLENGPAGFQPNGSGGLVVSCFSDLKRHNMGPDLAETFGHHLDPFFVTPRLWGIADTAPYLHDGRALTLTDAIEMHGGEGATASANFTALGPADRIALLTFLRTLRTPLKAAPDLQPISHF